MTERIDPDYDPSEKEVQHLARLLSLVAGRVGSLHVGESANSNGFQKWILGIVAAVAVMGVGGLVAMYGRLAAVEVSLIDVKIQVTNLESLIRDTRK